MTVRVDDVRGVAGFILPGDFVDIVLIAEDAAARRENYSKSCCRTSRSSRLTSSPANGKSSRPSQKRSRWK